LILEAGRTSRNYWADLWRYRELMYFLAWRDVIVRYKQTAIGVAWTLIRPAATMLVFVAFRKLVGINTGGAPEAIFVFAAVLPWQFFSTALSESSASLIGNSDLISKVYFPRLLVPSAAVVTALVDFVITLGLLALLMMWYGVAPGWQLATLPFFVVLMMGFSIGMGVLLSALNVEYRDFRYIVPFILQFGLFVSPVAFTLSNVPERWRALYSLNPLAGIIDGFRWAILGGQHPFELEPVLIATLATAASLYFGVWYFRRMERVFADVI
jgi:lipopolysaccharide transport system permease protein